MNRKRSTEDAVLIKTLIEVCMRLAVTVASLPGGRKRIGQLIRQTIRAGYVALPSGSAARDDLFGIEEKLEACAIATPAELDGIERYFRTQDAETGRPRTD